MLGGKIEASWWIHNTVHLPRSTGKYRSACHVMICPAACLRWHYSNVMRWGRKYVLKFIIETGRNKNVTYRYFIKLFEWIKDMNWPGADIIYRRLSLVPSQKIMWAYKYSVSIAEQTHDDIWNLVLSDFYIDNLSETGKKWFIYYKSRKCNDIIKRRKLIGFNGFRVWFSMRGI